MASVWIIMEREAWEDNPHSAWANHQDSINHCAILNEMASIEDEDMQYWIKEMVIHG